MSMPEPIVPTFGQRGKYKPKPEHVLTVDLPGEAVRALIVSVVNDDSCVCQIQSVPVATPRHGYQRDDTICVRRAVKEPLGVECWQVISDREMRQRENVARFEESERQKAAEAEADRVSALREADLAAQAKAEADAKLASTPWYKRPKE